MTWGQGAVIIGLLALIAAMVAAFPLVYLPEGIPVQPGCATESPQ